MPLTVSDPTTYTVPIGQALLYKTVENGADVFYSRYSDIVDESPVYTSDTVSRSVIASLGLTEEDLPCLVYKTDLINAKNGRYVSIGELVTALSSKASVRYVKQIADLKVSKSSFLNTISVMPTTDEMNQALALKADASSVSANLSGKANATDVYTKNETLSILESFIGASTVDDFNALNALEPGVYRFVWVLDPSDDISLDNPNVPALYRWREAFDNVPAGYEFLQSASTGGVTGMIQDVLDIIGTGFDSSNTVSSAISVKANASDLTTHTGNSDIHVTSADKSTWSAKQNAITGEEGQFVKIGADHAPYATNVDFSSFGTVKTVNGVSPVEGNVTLTIPSDISDLSDTNGVISGKADSSDLTSHTGNTNVHVTAADKEAWSGKQDAIQGVSGQFVKFNSSGVPVGETVDLSVYAKSVNNITPDSNGNISLTIPADVSGALTTHTDNTDIHVTAADKSAWSAKQNAITGDRGATPLEGQFVRISANGTPVAKSVNYDTLASEFDLHAIARKIVFDESNLILDTVSDPNGLGNVVGGIGLEVISYRRLHDTNDAAGAIIQVAPVGSVHNAFGRYVDLYDSEKTAIELCSAAVQSKGLYGYVRTGESSYTYSDGTEINSTKNLVDLIDKVKASTGENPYLSLYYMDVAHANDPKTGTLCGDIPKATFAGNLYWKMPTGSTVQPSGADEYLTTDKLTAVGLGTFDNEETGFDDVYTKSGEGINVTYTKVLNADDLEDGNYCLEDRTVITSIGQIVTAYEAANGDYVYHSVHKVSDNSEILSAAVVKSGIYKKEGSGYAKIRPYMLSEKFTKSSFSDGVIFIHPGTSNFTGMVTQAYPFITTEGTGIAYITETVAGETTIKKAIIRIDVAITDGDFSRTTIFEPKPGSLNNPVYAVIPSPSRYSTSVTTGEYNTAVGYNSEAGGNQNVVFGDFSEANGLVNVVSGDMSFAHGAYNIVHASQSNAIGFGNIIAGTQNITLGSSNLTHGYYGVAIGEGNQIFGLSDITIGSKNTLYTTTGGSVVIGDQNIGREKARDTVIVGKELDVSAEFATVIGQKGIVPAFNGNVPDPSIDTSTISAASLAVWKESYDPVWTSNKEGLVFCAGIKENRTISSISPLLFTKYRVRPNMAYFSVSSADRGSLDPYIFEPYMQWTFTGIINMHFTDPQVDPNNSTKFTFSKRNGGRVKSFDPGILVNANGSSTVTPKFDFDKATRWKLAADGVFKPAPYNFVDGAEAYVVIYHGASVDWTAFTNNPNDDEGANSFSSLVWKADTPYMLTGDTKFKSGKTYYTKNGDTYTEASVIVDNSVTAFTYYVKEVDASSYTTGFALVKLMVVDNGETGNANDLVCVAEVVANTLA